MSILTRLLVLTCLIGAFLPCHRSAADEFRRRSPESQLYFGAVAADMDLTSDPILDITNSEDMTDSRLAQIASRIEEITNRHVVIDEHAITDSKFALDADTKISWAKGESIQQLLKRLPKSNTTSLIWETDERVLRLTTEERFHEKYSTKRYFVGDFVTDDFPIDRVMQLIEEQSSGPWDNDEPGTGTITPLGNHLYVRQTSKVQAEIDGVLQMLRSDKPIVLLGRSEDDLRILRLLEESIVSFDWDEIELEEFFQRLEAMTQVQFQLDKDGLLHAGLDLDTIIDAHAIDLPLMRAIEIHLENVNGTALRWYLTDDKKVGITIEGCSFPDSTVLLNLTSLGITGDRLDQFVTLIQNETSGPWDEDEPGTGTISVCPSRNSLIIHQTRDVQREILEILADLRTLPKDQPLFPAASTKPVTRYYVLHPESAKALAILIPDTIAPGTWEPTQSAEGTSEKDLSKELSTTPEDASPEKARYGRLIVIPIPEQKQAIQILSDINAQFGTGPSIPQPQNNNATQNADCYLAITHIPDVHRQIEKLLKKLHQIPEHDSNWPRQGGGGGFFQVPNHR